MKWTRLSSWCIQSGNYYIGRYAVCDKIRYIAWHERQQLGVFDDADAAKRLVGDVARGIAPPQELREEVGGKRR